METEIKEHPKELNKEVDSEVIKRKDCIWIKNCDYIDLKS